VYEHLKSLEPCGVPLLGSLKLLNTDQVAAINQAHPDVPPEYLSFLLEIGWGEWKDEIGFAAYNFFSTLENAAVEYFRDELIYEDDEDNSGAKGVVWLFGCDSTGEAFGFDSGDGWQLVKIDTCRSVLRLNMSLVAFVEGLLVCYPHQPIRYFGGRWADCVGELYPK
jgi:hypothetical protein